MPLERRILLWMCMLVAVNQLGFGAMIPSLPLYAQSFGVPASAIGMAVAVYGAARFFTALPSGQMADRLGRRPTIAIGGLVSTIGNFWCAWAHSYPEFIVARFVAGAGAGLILTTGQVVLADISRPENRARTIALYQGTFIFAVGIGPFPGGLLAQHYGLAAPFVATGIASLIATCVAWFAVTETRDLAANRASKGTPASTPLSTQLKLLSAKIGFVLVSGIAFMSTVVRTGGLFALVPIIIAERLALSPAAIGFGFALGSVVGLGAAYPSGWLADRYGRKWVIVPATGIMGLSMAVYCFAPSYAWFLVASVAWGVAISVASAAPAAYAADSAPPGMNAGAMSTYRMAADFGYVVGPIALGLAADLVGAKTALLASAVALAIMGAAFALFAPETRR